MKAKELRIGNYIQDNLEDVFTVGGTNPTNRRMVVEVWV
jgi:hypothetical protein